MKNNPETNETSTNLIIVLSKYSLSFVKLSINICSEIIKIIIKSCKGFNYCFLKNPSFIKYLGFLSALSIGIIIIIRGAKHWGILTTCIGSFIPVLYLSQFSKYLDEYNSKVKELRKIISNQIYN